MASAKKPTAKKPTTAKKETAPKKAVKPKTKTAPPAKAPHSRAKKTAPAVKATKATKTKTPAKGTKKASKAVRTQMRVPTATTGPTRGVDFRPGSDAEKVWAEILKGGMSRREVQARLEEQFEAETTRGGNPKPVSTVMNQVIRRALAEGYSIVSTWSLVPPTGAALNGGKPKEPKLSVKARKKTPVPKTAAKKPSAKKTPAAKVAPAKKATKPKKETAGRG